VTDCPYCGRANDRVHSSAYCGSPWAVHRRTAVCGSAGGGARVDGDGAGAARHARRARSAPARDQGDPISCPFAAGEPVGYSVCHMRPRLRAWLRDQLRAALRPWNRDQVLRDLGAPLADLRRASGPLGPSRGERRSRSSSSTIWQPGAALGAPRPTRPSASGRRHPFPRERVPVAVAREGCRGSRTPSCAHLGARTARGCPSEGIACSMATAADRLPVSGSPAGVPGRTPSRATKRWQPEPERRHASPHPAGSDAASAT